MALKTSKTSMDFSSFWTSDEEEGEEGTEEEEDDDCEVLIEDNKSNLSEKILDNRPFLHIFTPSEEILGPEWSVQFFAEYWDAEVNHDKIIESSEDLVNSFMRLVDSSDKLCIETEKGDPTGDNPKKSGEDRDIDRSKELCTETENQTEVRCDEWSKYTKSVEKELAVKKATASNLFNEDSDGSDRLLRDLHIDTDTESENSFGENSDLVTESNKIVNKKTPKTVQNEKSNRTDSVNTLKSASLKEKFTKMRDKKKKFNHSNKFFKHCQKTAEKEHNMRKVTTEKKKSSVPYSSKSCKLDDHQTQSPLSEKENDKVVKNDKKSSDLVIFKDKKLPLHGSRFNKQNSRDSEYENRINSRKSNISPRSSAEIPKKISFAEKISASRQKLHERTSHKTSKSEKNRDCGKSKKSNDCRKSRNSTDSDDSRLISESISSKNPVIESVNRPKHPSFTVKDFQSLDTIERILSGESAQPALPVEPIVTNQETILTNTPIVKEQGDMGPSPHKQGAVKKHAIPVNPFSKSSKYSSMTEEPVVTRPRLNKKRFVNKHSIKANAIPSAPVKTDKICIVANASRSEDSPDARPTSASRESSVNNHGIVEAGDISIVLKPSASPEDEEGNTRQSIENCNIVVMNQPILSLPVITNQTSTVPDNFNYIKQGNVNQQTISNNICTHIPNERIKTTLLKSQVDVQNIVASFQHIQNLNGMVDELENTKSKYYDFAKEIYNEWIRENGNNLKTNVQKFKLASKQEVDPLEELERISKIPRNELSLMLQVCNKAEPPSKNSFFSKSPSKNNNNNELPEQLIGINDSAKILEEINILKKKLQEITERSSQQSKNIPIPLSASNSSPLEKASQYSAGSLIASTQFVGQEATGIQPTVSDGSRTVISTTTSPATSDCGDINYVSRQKSTPVISSGNKTLISTTTLPDTSNCTQAQFPVSFPIDCEVRSLAITPTSSATPNYGETQNLLRQESSPPVNSASSVTLVSTSASSAISNFDKIEEISFVEEAAATLAQLPENILESTTESLFQSELGSSSPSHRPSIIRNHLYAGKRIFNEAPSNSDCFESPPGKRNKSASTNLPLFSNFSTQWTNSTSCQLVDSLAIPNNQTLQVDAANTQTGGYNTTIPQNSSTLLVILNNAQQRGFNPGLPQNNPTFPTNPDNAQTGGYKTTIPENSVTLRGIRSNAQLRSFNPGLPQNNPTLPANAAIDQTGGYNTTIPRNNETLLVNPANTQAIGFNRGLPQNNPTLPTNPANAQAGGFNTTIPQNSSTLPVIVNKAQQRGFNPDLQQNNPTLPTNPANGQAGGYNTTIPQNSPNLPVIVNKAQQRSFNPDLQQNNPTLPTNPAIAQSVGYNTTIPQSNETILVNPTNTQAIGFNRGLSNNNLRPWFSSLPQRYPSQNYVRPGITLNPNLPFYATPRPNQTPYNYAQRGRNSKNAPNAKNYETPTVPLPRLLMPRPAPVRSQVPIQNEIRSSSPPPSSNSYYSRNQIAPPTITTTSTPGFSNYQLIQNPVGVVGQVAVRRDIIQNSSTHDLISSRNEFSPTRARTWHTQQSNNT